MSFLHNPDFQFFRRHIDLAPILAMLDNLCRRRPKPIHHGWKCCNIDLCGKNRISNQGNPILSRDCSIRSGMGFSCPHIPLSSMMRHCFQIRYSSPLTHHLAEMPNGILLFLQWDPYSSSDQNPVYRICIHNRTSQCLSLVIWC